MLQARYTNHLKKASAILERLELAKEITAIAAESLAEELRQFSEGDDSACSTRDELTGLPDRVSFIASLEARVSATQAGADEQYAILVVDIDHFIRVTARFGDSGGDELIQAVAERLTETMSAAGHEAVIARLGGDRFGILLSDEAVETATMAAAQRIHDRMRAAFEVHGEPIFASASIGGALAAGSTRPRSLLHDAELAMAQVMSRGGGMTLLFRVGMENLPAFQLLRERDVRIGVERNEFIEYFQPIVDAKRGGLHAFEALLRWRNPVEGLLPPSMFLDVLNETGLIGRVGRRVIEDSCEHAARWLALSGSLVPVSVNIVPAQLYDDGFADFIAHMLMTHDLPGDGLILELTESSLIQDATKAGRQLAALREMGVRVLIDDFGTGYSSLAYLHDLPVAGLKLDRGFFGAIPTCPKQREIVRTIIGLAHTLGLFVVAEGIETDDQWHHVRALECDFVQGFNFARPLDAEHATRYLARQLARGEAA
jgi:diguanylate cyclase (GGDEF)-like protein